MRIAVEGCAHGELDKIYASLRNVEAKQKVKIDLLLICGDFQSIRNEGDLKALACPDKYRDIGVFHEYYTGKKKAPIPTIFIGGNHEASNYLFELFHGGWVCPNIYFLGFAGVINFNGIRIGGLSGIYKNHHYELGHYEQFPLNEQDGRSIYHIRKYDVFRMAQIKRPVDIFLSHDWPRGIAQHGNLKWLQGQKPFLMDEIMNNTLGSYPAEFLMKRLKPTFWFAAHLHVKYAALFDHRAEAAKAAKSAKPAPKVENPDAISISDDDDPDVKEEAKNKKEKPAADEKTGASEESSENVIPDANGHESSEAVPSGPSYTRFLALDKCLPHRDFLQIIEIDAPEDATPGFCYDEEWLAIVKSTNDYFSTTQKQKQLPTDLEIQPVIAENLEWVKQNITPNGLHIPDNFVMSTPPHLSETARKKRAELGNAIQNPQTVALCQLLDMPNHIHPTAEIATFTGDVATEIEPPKAVERTENAEVAEATETTETTNETKPAEETVEASS
ncbi:lariat debranching enzyme [Chytridiales sp. JEL 0842]|nr:lariat debranching enzyme [Chytridiales sp. JEL 0842]